ncbi:methyltransferase domain-containing protein [Streptomyces sp. DSM 44915]|uniref:Methyltransferase domain-containing protein n=1 Tax=Streptomyces chisholmiae TaxID=3075540 RepID=A0ABU2JJE6_9ACTN|nr:methyltransferase domain-containing protein [Streptomyces sp. DSM 44915]MDT0265110.1 methyltransferase domain-containing protein [Streptomyces sp. DSM 44915]
MHDNNSRHRRADAYPDLDHVYAQCSGPGGLRLAEHMAEAMGLRAGATLVDIGSNRGLQTCFLAREYQVTALALDPWEDREDGRPMVEHVIDNARSWGVADRVLALRAGVPETGCATGAFDFAYSTTALEMIRALEGRDGYQAALGEILRILRPGGVFGLGEPMHLEVPIPEDLRPYVTRGEFSWAACFSDLTTTVSQVTEAGFEIVHAEYAADATAWWDEFARHDPFAKTDPEGDPTTLRVDAGRWTSFGVVIARKPLD